VYRFALSDPGRIKPLKSSSRVGVQNFQTNRVSYRPPNQPASWADVFLTLLNTTYYKDRLAHAIHNKMTLTDPATGVVTDEVEQWTLNAENDPDYNRQMTSEHKILVRRPNGRRVEAWTTVSTGAANHYWELRIHAVRGRGHGPGGHNPGVPAGTAASQAAA
jgi:hypothetical protein